MSHLVWDKDKKREQGWRHSPGTLDLANYDLTDSKYSKILEPA